MLRQIAVLGLIFFFIACQKKNKNPIDNKETCQFKNQECDSAIVTIYNRTQDTIYYGVGTNIWEDILLPGQQRNLKYGRVKVTYDANCLRKRESWSTHQLSSNWGEWAFNIDHCEKKSAFEYADTSKTIINLYDVTEY